MPWGPGGDHWGEKAAGSPVGMKAKAQVQSESAGAPWAHTLPAPSGLDEHSSPQCPVAPVLTDMGVSGGDGEAGSSSTGQHLLRVTHSPGGTGFQDPGLPADLRFTWFCQISLQHLESIFKPLLS